MNSLEPLILATHSPNSDLAADVSIRTWEGKAKQQPPTQSAPLKIEWNQSAILDNHSLGFKKQKVKEEMIYGYFASTDPCPLSMGSWVLSCRSVFGVLNLCSEIWFRIPGWSSGLHKEQTVEEFLAIRIGRRPEGCFASKFMSMGNRVLGCSSQTWGKRQELAVNKKPGKWRGLGAE